MDPERAHALALQALKMGIAPLPGPVTTPRLETRLAGLALPNPVGLAAGFDKECAHADALARAGFGQVDIQDAGSDLNAYRDGGHAACCGPESPMDAASSCCSPAAEPAPAAQSSCCGSETTPAQAPPAEAETQPAYHDTMGDLLDSFDVNAYAASVKIFAVKP